MFHLSSLPLFILAEFSDASFGLVQLQLVDCVISVPVYFNDEQRHALLNSSRIAGLRCLKLMNETAAVALAYGIYKSDLPEESAKPRRVVFCDFGHTSLQVQLIGRTEKLAHFFPMKPFLLNIALRRRFSSPTTHPLSSPYPFHLFALAAVLV